MPDRKQFVGRWVSWVKGGRIEQELFDDGKFDGVVSMKKVKRLKPEQSFQFTFPIIFGGVASPLHIRVFMDDMDDMDDMDAADAYFYAPQMLASQIDDEILRLDARSEG